MRLAKLPVWCLLGFLSAHGIAPIAGVASAEVARIDVERRVPLLGGRAFGRRGAYELLEGRIHFAFDPANPANENVTDIALAPRNAQGLVEAWSELIVLQPVDPGKRRGTAIVEVVNRGRALALANLNLARLDFMDPHPIRPEDPDEFGDGRAMQDGLTLIWIGWQADAPSFPGSLRLRVPAARHPDGTSVRGLARTDWVVDQPTDTLFLTSMGHVPIPVGDPSAPANVLTVRDGRESSRRPLPRDRWQFGRAQDGVEIADLTAITMPGGFEVGRIYELVYEAEAPPLLGLGFAAFRDVIAYAKTNPGALFPAERGIAMGSSQSGRFLRHFLYQGFNRDERGHTAYDGVLINIAGAGRGNFNHRFGQPGRVSTRYGNFFYPVDLFPFTSRPTEDAMGRRRGGLLDRAIATGTLPKLFQVNHGYEYWGRGASLIHTTPDGARDVEPLASERLYHIASAPHYPLPFPPRPEAEIAEGVYRGSSFDTSGLSRALVSALVDWVETGREPPPSRVPRIDAGTLVAIEELDWPAIPSLETATKLHLAYRASYGPRFDWGILDLRPPRLGPAFTMRVSQVDEIGNEIGGIRSLELLAPVGTYTPWALRVGYPAAQDELLDFLGTFVPLSRTAAVGKERGDGRPSLEELYPDAAAYRMRVDAGIESMLGDRFLLEVDRDAARALAMKRWSWAQGLERSGK